MTVGMRHKPITVLYVVTHGEMGGVHRFIESIVFHHGSKFRALVLSFRYGSWLTELRNRGLTVDRLDTRGYVKSLDASQEVPQDHRR